MDMNNSYVSVKEQVVQEYLTTSSGILEQINLETLNNVINLRLKRSKFFLERIVKFFN